MPTNPPKRRGIAATIRSMLDPQGNIGPSRIKPTQRFVDDTDNDEDDQRVNADSLVAHQRGLPFSHDEDAEENRLRDKIYKRRPVRGLAEIVKANLRGR